MRNAPSRRKSVIYSAVIAGLLGANSASGIVSSWVGLSTGNWSLNTNWSGSVTPNTVAYDVFIDGGNIQNSSVTLDLNEIIGSLTISAGDALGISNNTQLTVLGSAISNAGTITIGAGPNNTFLALNGSPVSLSGGGVVVLSETGGGAAIITGSATLTNVNNTIRGQGNIGTNAGVVINQGTISANVSGGILNLDTGNFVNSFVNSGNINATGGGILQFSGFGGGNMSNTGTLTAQTGSEVRLTSNASISGGTFSTAGTGTIGVAANQNAYLDSFTNAGNIVVNNNAALNLQGGTITNAGSININAAANTTYLSVNGTQTTSGAGTINLNSTAALSVITGTGTWTNANSIQGSGNVGNNALAITNSARILANNASIGLVIDPVNLAGAFINNGTLQANGGILTLSGFGGGDFVNTSGRIIATTNDVQLTSNVGITGGTLSSSLGGSVRLTPNQTAYLTSITNAGVINVENNASLYLNGVINNTGTIIVNAGANTTGITGNSGTTNFAGNGTVILGTTAGGTAYLGNAGTITNVNNLIRGAGSIGANGGAVINQIGGVFSADLTGQLLILDPVSVGTQAFLNQGLLRATAGGVLGLTGFGGGDFDNNAGTIEAQAGSEVRLFSNAVINGGTFNAIGSGTISVPDNQGVSINAARISGNVRIGNNSTLYLSGTTTNTGTITLNPTANVTAINFSGGTLGGGGSIVMNQTSSGLPSITGTGTLTSNNNISGAGSIGTNAIGFINNATITANNPLAALILDPANATSFVNNGTLQSTTGPLNITGFGNGDFQNAAGRIIAGAQDVNIYGNASVVGGTLSGASTGVFRVPASNTVFLTTLSLTGNLSVENNSTTNLFGTITNTGSININAGANTTTLYMTGPLTLSGGGTILMNQTTGGLPSITGTGTTTSNNNISGAGSIGTNAIGFINNATITATNPSAALILDPGNGLSFVNNGTMQSTTGPLNITGFGNGDFQNATGRIIAGAQDVNIYNNASVVGGTLSGSSTGVFRVPASNVANLTSLTTTGNWGLENNSTTNIAGTITNTGSINLNATANTTTLNAPGAGTLAGAGTIFMNKTGGGNPTITTPATLIINNTVIGAGSIGANQGGYVNNASITATGAGAALFLDPGNAFTFTNSGLLRATGGASLVVTGFGGGTFNGAGSVDVQASSFATFDNNLGFTNNAVINNGTVTVQNSSGVSITSIAGNGTLNVNNSSLATIRANGTQAATSKVVSLAVTNTSKLDLNDNALVIDYTGAPNTPLASVRSNIIAGYNNGAWNGNGIITTTGISAPTRGLGYSEAGSTNFATTFRGQSFAGGDAVLVMYTIKGDANLDRTVDSLDFNRFVAVGNYGISNGTALWSQGDFDYNGKVNTIDFNWLAGQFGQTLPAAGDLPEGLPGPSLGSVVPEPTTLSLIPLTMLALRRKRR